MTKKSEKQAKTDPHRKLPPKVANIPYNKFIALPDGLRIKSPITGVETENTSPRKPVPLKAVPLPSGGIDYDEYTGDIGVTTTVTNHAETDEFVRPGRTLHRRSGSQSSAGSVNGSLSSVPSSDASQFTPRGFYRKRSQSTPPDIGRQRNSPVDRRIGKLVNQYYNSLNNNNIELIGDPGISDYNSNWNYDDISSTHSSLDIEDYGDVFDYDVTSKQCHKSNTFEDIPTGHSFIMHPHYLTLPRNTQFSNVVYNREGGGESLKSNSMRGRPQLSLAHTNGTLPRGNGVLVYKPSNTSEVIMMGNYPANHNGYIPGNNNLPVEDKQKSSLSLFKSRAKSASMPTLLDTNSKDYKKFLKEVKRQEKEEKKRLEKEERRRIKEEKKRRKAFEKEQKQKIKTLPRNWNYVNRPIESVYARPRLSLSAVPIDFEDGPAASYRSTPPPSVAPPPPPQPSLRTRAIYSSAPDLLRLEQVYGATIRGQVPQGRVPLTNGIYSNYVSDYAPRTVVLQRGPEGYGFVLRGAKSQSKTAAELDFHPTPEFPALQYLDSVDPGSKADRAGLKGGDFILEINGENVVRASHDRVVQIIRQSGDTLALKVVTVKPISKPDHWLQHQDGSMTLPSRTSKKPAPQPPQRDPQTSLSVSKADGKHIAEGMAELERIAKTSSPDELDLALAQYETQEVPVVTSEQKTASIRAKHSAKRVSCVELENIVTDDQQKAKDYMSPSEMRIKKYHKKQNGGMERANSNPDLLSDGKRSEPVYATPGGNVKSEHKRSGSIGDTSRHTYAIPGDLPNGDNVSLRSSISSGSGSRLQSPSTERPKGAPPAPPNGNSVPKRPAPQPPPGVDPVAPAKTELVSISTNRKSVNVTEIKVNKSTTDSEYESSFRPGISAHLTNEPKVVTASVEQAKLKSHSRNTSVGSNKSSESQGSNKVTAPVDQDKPSVSFAEDKVYDSAKSFLQKHPNAQLLVTADIHGDTLKNKRKSSSYEPEPDYDADSDNDKLDSKKSVTQTKNSVTVISVGDTSTPKATSKQQYTISRSDIPSAKSGDDMVIPPPPSEPAPKPPSPKLNTSKPPSPKLGQTTKQEERRSSVDISPKTSPAPPPPAPPPPPVAPPVPTAPPPPASEQKVEEVKPMASLVAKGLPTEDILAAVAQRKARIDTGEIRMSEQPEKAKTTETWKKKFDETHNALLAAVAKRRSVLATTDEHAVVDQIESKLQKTKKLQAVKMYFGSDTSDKKETEKKDEEKKSETNASSASKGATPVKIDIAPATSVKKTAPVKTPVKTGVTPLKIEIASASSAKPNNTSTNVRKVSEDKTKTSTGGNTSNVKSSTTQQKTTAPKTPDKPANENKGNSSTTPTTNAQEKSTDFVAMAEKARQEWLQKKASSSSLKINTTTTTTSNGVGNKSPKSPPASQTTAKMNGTVTPTKSVTSITSISTKSTSSTKTSTQQTDKKSNNKGLTPMKSDRDSDVISKTTSIRDRIKNFEKTDSDSNGNLQSPGSSVSSSPDRKKSSTLPPPPPGFGDAVHIDIIPPPSGFNYDEGKHSGDSESVVSSVSTLSTLSDEHGDSGFGRQKHSYEDLIPPPPPGFDDNSDQSYEVIPSVIPPPPEFGGSSLNSISKPARTNKPFLAKPVDNWQCLDVLDWLDSLNMTQYKDSFQKHCINGKKLMGLTRNDYIELGVTQVGHRMNLERSIKKAAIRRNSGVES